MGRADIPGACSNRRACAPASFHGVNAYPLARARRNGAVTLWEKVNSLTPGIARRGDMLLVQIAEAREIGMADFLDLHANRVL